VFGAALGCAALLGGCVRNAGEKQIRSQFATLFDCDEAKVEVARNKNDDFKATGCDHEMTYRCGGRFDGSPAVRSSCRPLDAADLPQPATSDAVTELHLTLALGDGVVLGLAATPAASEDGELSVFGYYQKDCELGVMIDGERRDLDASDRGLKVPKPVMRDLSKAQQIVLRLCNRRWSLEPEDMVQVRHFAARYFEEIGWERTGSQSDTGERPAPRGGWQPWQALKDFPLAAGEPLAAAALFEKVSPSIARVEGTLSDGLSQGSAVAVTPKLLLTNCHVVAGATRIKVSQGKNEWPARLMSSDVGKDRCVLEVSGAQLKPVQGVRPYVDLKVGERLYTVGNPSGLDLTLADGLLSALREEDGVRYVQTTAPISPGSSGGGLFDARGNLVGITTLVVVGKEHLNQSLNFAIAAEMFWSP
jgi:hypothetical protein